MIKIILTSSLVVALLTFVSVSVPTVFTSAMDSAFLYFFGLVRYLDFVIDPQVVLNCIQVLGNMLLTSVLFRAGRGIYRAVAA